MKLHLPRLLAAAVLAAVMSAPAYAERVSVTPPEGYDSAYTVSEAGDVLTFPSQTGSYALYLLGNIECKDWSVDTGAVSQGNFLFSTYTGNAPAALSFIDGTSLPIRDVTGITFDTLSSLNFSNNTGGAILGQSGSTVLITNVKGSDAETDVTFSNNVGTNGAIHAGTVTISGNGSVSFNANEASSSPGGGAIYAENDVTVSGNTGLVSFTNNHGANAGGAILAVGNAILSDNIAGLSFIGNTTTNQGGAITAINGNVILTGNGDILFDSNQLNAPSGGAAIGITNGKVIISENIGDIVFTKNGYQYLRGGAIYSKEGGVVISDNKQGDIAFTNNTASRGSAIFVYKGGVEVTGNRSVSFADNTGAAVFAEASAVKLNGNTGTSVLVDDGSGSTYTKSVAVSFSNNTTTIDKGGAAIYACGVELSDNEGGIEFISNYARNADADYYPELNSYGGAIYSTGDVDMLNNSTISFRDNGCYGHGGAIYASESSVTLSGNDAGYITVNVGTGTIKQQIPAISFANNIATRKGGAIYADNVTITDNTGSVEFVSNKAQNGSGGAIYAATGDITLTGNAAILFDANKAINGQGGAIYTTTGAVYLTGNGDIAFDSNEATKGMGGAIYSSSADTPLDISNNGDVSFTGNTASTNSGAIYTASGVVSLTGNGDITFDSNTASSGQGGAIYSIKGGSVTISDNGDVSLTGNRAATTGGALHIDTNNALIVSGNGDVSLTGNRAATTGGALHIDTNSALTVSGNGDVAFDGNTATGNGGAIYADYNNTINITGNTGDISFSDNTAANGAAIYLGYNSVVNITNNVGDVTFSNNIAGSGAAAIFVKGRDNRPAFEIRNNGNVLFEKNAVVNSNGEYILRSVIMDSGMGATVNLSAAEGKYIEFRDSIDGCFNLKLNEAYQGTAQTGEIIFTGAYTENHLAELLTAAGETRNSTSEEIRESRETVIYGAVTLNGGTLRVEDGAVFSTQSLDLTKNAGATLLVKDATVGSGTVNHRVTLNEKNYMVVQGSSTINDNLAIVHSKLTIDEGFLTVNGALSLYNHGTNIEDILNNTILEFNLTEAHRDRAAISIDTNLLYDQQILVKLNLAADADAGRYLLMDMTNSDRKDFSCIIHSSGAASHITYASRDLVWDNGLVYFDVATLEWSAQNGNVWSTDSFNWQKNRLYKNGVNVNFTDAAVGTVQLSGDLKAATVTVDNSTGEYVFTVAEDGGRLAGATNLVKRGSGELTLETDNTHTGTTTLEAGTLNLHHSNALGASTLTAAEGTTLGVGNGAQVVLDKANHSIAGNVAVAEGSALEIKGDAGSAYKASESIVAGTLSFTDTQVTAGNLNGGGKLEVLNSQVAFNGTDASQNFGGDISLTGANSTLSTSANISTNGHIDLKGGKLIALNSLGVTVADGGKLSMTSDATIGENSIITAESVFISGGAELSASQLEAQMTFALNEAVVSASAESTVLNSAVGGVIDSPSLTLDAGSTLVLNQSHIDLNGGALTLQPNGDSKINLVMILDGELTADSSVILFSDVASLNFGSSFVGGSQFTFAAADFFAGDMIGENTLVVFENGTVTMTGLVPEPTTATLSLLALAGLAMRRRRK